MEPAPEEGELRFLIMYYNGQFEQKKNKGPVAFRGGFLMSPRIAIFLEEDGCYRPLEGQKKMAFDKNDRKNHVLFSRN